MVFIVSGGELVGSDDGLPRGLKFANLTGDTIRERRPTGATHSFRLTPAAYSIIEGVPKKNKANQGRSAWVSDAIIYYATSTTKTVTVAMMPVVYPNMPVASPEKLHAELIKLNARCEWWVRKYNEERDEHDRLKNRSFISRIRKLWRK